MKKLQKLKTKAFILYSIQMGNNSISSQTADSREKPPPGRQSGILKRPSGINVQQESHAQISNQKSEGPFLPPELSEVINNLSNGELDDALSRGSRQVSIWQKQFLESFPDIEAEERVFLAKELRNHFVQTGLSITESNI
jgi:hypothetical protein